MPEPNLLDDLVGGLVDRVKWLEDAYTELSLQETQDVGSGSSPTFTALTLSGLTAGRVVYSGAGGLLKDDPDFTFDGLRLSLLVQGATGGIRVGGDVDWYRGAADTWQTPDSVIIGTGLNVNTTGAAAGGIFLKASASGQLVIRLEDTSAAERGGFQYQAGGFYTFALRSAAGVQTIQADPSTGMFIAAVNGSGGGFVAGATSDAAWYRGGADLWTTPDSVSVLGGLGVGITAPAAGSAHITGAATLQLRISSVETNNTRKNAQIVLTPYVTAQIPFGLVYGDVNTGADNQLILGGGTAALQAATNILFYTAAAVNTGTGTLRLTIDPNGDFTFFDGADFILGSTTGTKIGTATTQKLGFYNATPIVRGTAFTQTYATAATTLTQAAMTDPAVYGAGANGYSTAAMAQAIHAEVIALKANMVVTQNVMNGVIDQIQALGLFG